MTETEPPLTHEERLLIVGLYVALSQSQNRPSLGRLAAERSCYADHDIHGLKSLSHKRIPESQMIEGLETC
ncbi:hypothetical protein PP568_09800 [Mycobacteroides abscessus]|uniref:hypothetical protein n=1 Tax=Mycobacteroides abscessus TaxID=36809 RepID=UPI0005DCD1E2|nr:hypothetical protein [Mycobacteroides abscessus]MBN7460700.1 hypothetical protein [Mycobacteroides abscessus subsp. abscessus]MBN7557526.1 hypothetical protein [Mycobacteroides abscessus subsp. abscessus]MDM2407480.1 hypothetical protein [Mycobacteroides abscessus]MDM2414945.1 hypothetical protein [Mycobacteroides abscessus]MDO3012252.1 hypothetical protein [Mycobacteroides abscessus subsp. abscessus]